MTDVVDVRQEMIIAAHAEWLRRIGVQASPLDHVTALVEAALDGITHGAIADLAVTQRAWQAVSKLLPIAAERLRLISGSGCEAGAQRSYLRGQYDLLASELWVALDLPVPPEFAAGQDAETPPQDGAAFRSS